MARWWTGRAVLAAAVLGAVCSGGHIPFRLGAERAYAATPAAADHDDDLVIPVVRGDTTYTVVVSFLMAKEADPAGVAAAQAVYRERFGAGGASRAASSYALQGFHWTGSTAAWSYNPAGKPAALSAEQPLVAAAAATWNGAGSAFHFTSGATSNAQTGACHGAPDGRNTIGWAAQPGSVLAVTCAWYNGNVASEFDMEIDPDWEWTTTADKPGVDFQSVVLHELGHALGLAHSQDKAAVMYAAYPWGTIAHDLTDDDRSAIAALYGPGANEAPAGAPKASVSLAMGANLLTWAGAEMPPAQALASVLASVREVYAMDPSTGSWKRYLPGAPSYVSNLELLRTGIPYWIITSGTATLQIEP